MKVKGLIKEISEAAEGAGFRARAEYPTDDKTRIDVAILNDEEPVLAVEFEKTYKWIRGRILYNGIKAHRAGFSHLLLIFPFQIKNIPNSWVFGFLEELGMEIELIHPDDCISRISEILKV